MKVLILSGGGIFGFVPCHFLNLVDDVDLEKIDVIAGTSIGGILALCYASDLGVQKTYELFKTAAPEIFRKNWLRVLFTSSLYSSKGIEKFLQQALPGKVRDCRKKFIVPAMDFRKRALVVFQNFDESYLEYDLWKIGRSTSAAPMFFEPYSENVLVDGGIVENVPVGISYTVLQKYLNVPKNEIDVLVLGTGSNLPNDDLTLKQIRRFSLIRWAIEILPVIATKANEMLSVAIGENLGFRSFQYFNPTTIHGRLDDASQVTNGSLEESCELYDSLFLRDWKKFLKK